MKVFDLSMTMQPMWRWQLETKLVMDVKKEDPYRVTAVKTSMHAFTHIDTPLHIEPERESIDQVNLERLCGPAAVIDLTPVLPNQKIGREYLEKRAHHLKTGDIVILKTCWDIQRAYTSREYWLEAPFLSEDAAKWLADQPITAVGFDFPQDYVIREIPGRHPHPAEMPTHDLILRKGILLIEYLCNLEMLQSPRVEIYASCSEIN